MLKPPSRRASETFDVKLTPLRRQLGPATRADGNSRQRRAGKRCEWSAPACSRRPGRRRCSLTALGMPLRALSGHPILVPPTIGHLSTCYPRIISIARAVGTSVSLSKTDTCRLSSGCVPRPAALTLFQRRCFPHAFETCRMQWRAHLDRSPLDMRSTLTSVSFSAGYLA